MSSTAKLFKNESTESTTHYYAGCPGFEKMKNVRECRQYPAFRRRRQRRSDSTTN